MVVIQYPLVIFINGYWARCTKQYPTTKDGEGKKRKKLRLSISEAIKDGYGIKENVVIGDYPAKKVLILSMEHTHPCILVLCGFRGEKTDFEEFHPELLSTIEIYEKNEQVNMTQIVNLLEKNKELSDVNEKQLKKIAGLMKILAMKKDKDEGTTEGEDESGG